MIFLTHNLSLYLVARRAFKIRIVVPEGRTLEIVKVDGSDGSSMGYSTERFTGRNYAITAQIYAIVATVRDVHVPGMIAHVVASHSHQRAVNQPSDLRRTNFNDSLEE
jgi:hypothetical protein